MFKIKFLKLVYFRDTLKNKTSNNVMHTYRDTILGFLVSRPLNLYS